MGVAKLAEVPMVMISMKGMGSILKFCFTDRAMGNMMAAPALLVMISEYKLVIRKSPAMIPTTPNTFNFLNKYGRH
jgi:hypothetical protein